MGLFLTDASCIKQRATVNIPPWNIHGYTGKGQVIFHDDLGVSGHNGACIDIIQTILPDAKIYSGSINGTLGGSVSPALNIHCNETGETLPFESFIKKYNISILNNSTTGGNNNSDSDMAVYMREMIKKYNLIFTGAAGNYTEETSNPYQGACIMVSGVDIMKNGSWADYGVSGDSVDFCMFMGFQDGTSFAAPFLCGMCGLLRDKYGRSLTQPQVYEYFKSHCKDLGTVGKDPQWGWGLPIMGTEKKTIILTTGSNIMKVDDISIVMDTMPIIDASNRMLVPVRPIGENLGCAVTAKTVVIAGKNQIEATLKEI